MIRKILLNKNKGKESVNETNVIPIDINRNASLFHDEIKVDTINTMEVYNNEKDMSTKHRFIFTIYPVFSNSLFNNLTEIIYKEGSPDCINLPNTGTIEKKITNTDAKISNNNINRVNAIRNTEYSNNLFDCTYHCGLDIFNNHLFRAKEEVSVQKVNARKYCNVYDNDLNTYLKQIDSFNTLGDYVRNYKGEYIEIQAPRSDFLYKNLSFDKVDNKKYLPLYMYDTVKNFEESYNDNIERKDGWIGFKNPITLNVPIKTITINGNKLDYYVNKVLNNKEGGQFIDMCPERDLFYFTPKKNLYLKRLEYNWDYCLTYPEESVYDGFSLLTGKGNGLPLFKFDDNSYYIENTNDNGLTILTLRTVTKHNLNTGDYVYLKFSNNEKIKCRVINVGGATKEMKERYFSILKSDIEPYISSGSYPERFIKTIQGYECEYYFRKFKKINKDFNSTIYKLAFANTIYGDEVSQIVYNDTIDINEYKDNRGRPLTEIYLTIVKTNRGHNEWYNNRVYSDETIEYSHVFGKVSSGLDIPSYAKNETKLPIVRRLHNISKTSIGDGNDIIYIPNSSTPIENDINISNDDFYGDLVEFNPITQDEIVLEKVMHRFNTAQREVENNDLYKELYYDEIGMDIYDKDNENGLTSIIRKKKNSGYANLSPEGYIYQPHHRIQIGKFDNIVNQDSDIIMNRQSTKINDDKTITFTTSENYSLLPNDIVTIMNIKNSTIYNYVVVNFSINHDIYEYTIKGNSDISFKDEDFIFFKHSNSKPIYATYLDNSGLCAWKNITPPSEYNFTDELSNIPFTNGSFYHHKNINFVIRRQDPFGKYEMYLKDANNKSVEIFKTPVSEFDLTPYEYIIDTNSSSCF